MFEDRAPMRPQLPRTTLGFLVAIGAVFMLQLLVNAFAGPFWHNYAFTVAPDWYLRPWSPITSTFAHGDLFHLFFNGLVLYFFGPNIEQIIGRRTYITLFLATGALSGILQVHINQAISGVAVPALGASGALMMLIGITVILMPKSQIIIFPVPVPIPMWVGGIAFAAMDLIGLASGGTGIGHIAHLSGMAVGLWWGRRVKDRMGRRGMRLVYG